MANEIPVIPPDMRKVYLRLRRWRSSHARCVPIPEPLWAAAGELARAHGINPTAKALLKQRAEAAMPAVKKRVAKATADIPRRARSAPPTFVELMAPSPGSFPGAVVELEGPRGRMRIELKGVATAEMVALSRALWSGEGRRLRPHRESRCRRARRFPAAGASRRGSAPDARPPAPSRCPHAPSPHPSPDVESLPARRPTLPTRPDHNRSR
jgi:hypothetical protein